jgi:hypothetical protein
LATDSWNGHTFEVRCEMAGGLGRIPGSSARVWVRVDGGRFEFVEAPLQRAANGDFARQHPGSRWLPLAAVPFRMRDGDSFAECKAEFDVSLLPPPGCDKTCRYRIFVGDEQAAQGEMAPKAAGDSLVFLLAFGGVSAALLVAIWLFNTRV